MGFGVTKSDDNVMNANTLINETNTLRDELLVAVAKLEQYAENLRHEAIRLKNVANREGDKRA